MICNSMKSIKAITIGEAAVGKTALTMRYAYNTFGLHEMTIGVDFAIKHMSDGGKIQIWDTAGQESFRSISRSYYRAADAALIVFSLNDLRSFSNVEYWYRDFRKINKHALCVLVGTKSELEKCVPEKKIQEMCNLLSLTYYETSAKCNINISSPFDYLYKHCNVNEEVQDKVQLSSTIKKVNELCC